MKLKNRFWTRDWVVQEIARFGAAKLVRLVSGRLRVQGGTRWERLEAKEWASLFCHEAIVEVDPPLDTVYQHARPANQSNMR
jgi:hypothetical protein